MIKNGRNKIKSGFTLIEIGLCLLIISILVMLCIPIISQQAKKTDEYSYYLAFKTIEKIGSQIVAFGDPEDSLPKNACNINRNFWIKHKLASYEDKTFKFFNPKASAYQTSEIVSFPSYEYDFLRVCEGNPNVMIDYDKDAGLYWTIEKLNERNQKNFCSKIMNPTYIQRRFSCPNVAVTEDFSTTTKTPYQYCQNVAAACNANYKFQHISLSTQSTNKAEYDECILYVKPKEIISAPLKGYGIDNTLYPGIKCSDYGLEGMSNRGLFSNINCICDASNPVKALNNSSMCCPKPPEGYGAYYYYDSSDNTGKCKTNPYCKINAFNENTHECCPEHSYYSKSLGKCVCYEGYTPNREDALTSCSISETDCPSGSHLENDVCRINSPITEAKRLCQLIAYNWNVSSSNCDTFSKVDGVNYYRNLYTAITKNNTPYLSVKAVKGAFNSKDIKPNITFANGLRMWILGDKSVSVAGLSSDIPQGFTPKINTCIYTGESESSCQNTDDKTGNPDHKAFCKNDNKCFKIIQGSSSLKIKDARNCCASADFTDIIKHKGDQYTRNATVYAINGFTVFVDINGTKDNTEEGGGGTLWKDVFPFYISANGHVYPGYPLNAEKAGEGKSDSSALYQGGNSSALSADVYYYTYNKAKNSRKRVNAYSSIPYARALCFSKEISAFTPYCQNLGTKIKGVSKNTSMENFIYSDSNPCHKHKCYVKLKNKIKYL